MSPTPILHLMNNLADFSISRIVERIISHADANAWQWHVGSTGKINEMEERYRALGAVTVSFSGKTRASRYEIIYMIKASGSFTPTHRGQSLKPGGHWPCCRPPTGRATWRRNTCSRPPRRPQMGLSLLPG